jgi:hypothetical protein
VCVLFHVGDEMCLNSKMFKFTHFNTLMRKDNSKEKKVEKQKKSHQPLSTFYSNEQKQEEIKQKYRKSITDTEMEIFEHLKNHTKKVLKNQKK